MRPQGSQQSVAMSSIISKLINRMKSGRGDNIVFICSFSEAKLSNGFLSRALFWNMVACAMSENLSNQFFWSTNTAWYLDSFWALFVLYKAQFDNKAY